MKVVYSPRAIRDLNRIAGYYTAVAERHVAAAVGARIEHVINRLAVNPFSAQRLTKRPGVRVALVLRYPYKIFYRVSGDTIEILHIRHTARRPWEGERG
jgi:plasmid stabilization system protein ParE